MRIVPIVALCLVIFAGSANTAVSASLDDTYFVGRWTPDPSGCGDAETEFLEFDDQGVFRGSRLGLVETVGLWELKEGLLHLHLLALPHFLTGRVQKPIDNPGYYKVRILPLNVQDNDFDAAVAFEDILKRAELSRCGS